MKKSLLALVIAACASQSVMAATVYDKDGTSLKVGGRVQAVLYKGGSDSCDCLSLLFKISVLLRTHTKLFCEYSVKIAFVFIAYSL